ncbi:MAG: hypothetical protein HY902_02055 [Deltaproteobacteria bacterium]|nr:hypothetical protein [Deltaproteobacteria bacterium]
MRRFLATLAVALPLATAGCSAILQATQGSAQSGTGTLGSAEHIDGALEGKLYYLSEGTDKLPDFGSLAPVGSIWATRFDVAPRDFTEGFPGVSNRTEWFALRYTGTWSVPAAGVWNFRLLADEGARWLIDGRLVADSDPQRVAPWVEGEINLGAGEHRVEMQFFQGPATILGLQLWATPPGGREEIWSVR